MPSSSKKVGEPSPSTASNGRPARSLPNRERYRDSAPTGGAMDIWLSFRTTKSRRPSAPMLFSPSNAIPALMAPSPITQMTSP